MRNQWLSAGMGAIVTGASSGIGKRISERLQSEGVTVAAFARDKESVKDGELCIPIKCDVTDMGSVERAVGIAARKLKSIDILVNAAGISMPKYMNFGEIDPTLWNKIIQTNLSGLYAICHYAMPHVSSSHGYIVNILSTAARRSIAGNAPYSASKHGGLSISETLAIEGENFGVRVCAVCPGAVDTPIWDKKENPPDEARRQEMMDSEDIADIVLFILKLPQHVRVDSIVAVPAPGIARNLHD